MVLRLLLLAGWTLFAMLIQSTMLILPGRGKEKFARVFWAGVAGILGLRVTIHGELADRRPVLYVANHSSWLDIVALGAALPGCFVAKAAIADWPVINWVAYLGRTIFVSRTRSGVGRERNALVRRLNAGDNIILFPEGTTSNGTNILPFSSSFLAAAYAGPKPWAQPVTLIYDALDGMPIRLSDRPILAWYGDMALLPHYVKLGRIHRIHATIILDPPIPPEMFADRKTLTAALQARITHNAAGLRQGKDRQSSAV
jgi:1-acyl-sn-glycerol-3-phosphate acyltransferase